jgi:hypothetical protein
MTGAPQNIHLLANLLGAGRPEVSCEVCFEQLDRYVELERAGEQAEKALPGTGSHLEGCAACREDHRSLHALLDGGWILVRKPRFESGWRYQ